MVELKELQKRLNEFDEARGWNSFPASQVFTHLIEELGEISRFITIEEGYKIVGIGHEAPKKESLGREFAQVFSLFVQLANHFGIDLETCIQEELEIMGRRFPEDEWAKRLKK
ncbi:MAG: MazG-like family protein [Candidatus Thorarchaeota archaeon]|nr:MazG-like family protein [Candidatus Thorarchaeota archaeon]